mmetsp:Transcript_26809/g.46517  ORF Transcript_26809/g.46517 Transcript_26809/m.46517 type:complete len:434 (-) Transcript_26809:204-1505(-)
MAVLHHMRVALSTTIACALIFDSEAVVSGKVLHASGANLTALSSRASITASRGLDPGKREEAIARATEALAKDVAAAQKEEEVLNSLIADVHLARLNDSFSQGTVRQPIKRPAAHTTDGLPRSLEQFDVVYWAFAMLAFWMAAIYFLHMRQEKTESDIEKAASQAQLADIPEEKKEEEEKEVFSVELCDNMWSLNYVAAIGQAKYGNGTYVTPGFTGIISVGMCVVQLAGLFLMIGAINPTALPWTKEPGAPWLKGESGMTVNLMKLFMTIFLAVGQVQEVSQSKKIITVAFSSGDHVYKKAWYKFIPLAGAALQYSVAMTVIWGGVATVLSFQTVPDIVYSSMSVFFFTTADEMFADATMQLFDITPDWEVQLSPEEEEAADPFKNEPIWMFLVLKFLQVFPAMFAFQLLGRAWMTGVMPIHHVDVPEPPAM